MRPHAVSSEEHGPCAPCPHEIELAQARRKIANLEIALSTSRRIATAVGILMAQVKLTDDEAFAVLTDISQRTHRKIRDIADEIVFTGALPTNTGL